MEIDVRTVSKLCNDVIHKTKIRVDQTAYPFIDEILNKVHEKYPTLLDTDYTLYWCYSHEEFFKIHDYLSYFTALTLMADRSIYLILNDCDECLEFNEAFLRKQDRREEKEEAERKRGKYDVKIVRPGEESESSGEEEEEVRTEARKDGDILRFARRKEQPAYYYTADLMQKFRMIEDAKRGIFGAYRAPAARD